MATGEKLQALEQKKADIEEALIDLTKEDNDTEDTENTEPTEDTFVTSNSRAAQLESEKHDLRCCRVGTCMVFVSKCENSCDRFSIHHSDTFSWCVNCKKGEMLNR